MKAHAIKRVLFTVLTVETVLLKRKQLDLGCTCILEFTVLLMKP